MSDPERKIPSQPARRGRRKIVRYGLSAALTIAVATYVIASTPDTAHTANPVDLGSAASFAVLAGTTVVNKSGNEDHCCE